MESVVHQKWLIIVLLKAEEMVRCRALWPVCLFGLCCSCCVLYSSGHRLSPSPFKSQKQQKSTPNVSNEFDIIVYVV